MMAACTPARPLTTWVKLKWTASWRSKVSVDLAASSASQAGHPFQPKSFQKPAFCSIILICVSVILAKLASYNRQTFDVKKQNKNPNI